MQQVYLLFLALLCKMNQMLPQLETALYQNGGIDFTGIFIYFDCRSDCLRYFDQNIA